MIEQTEQQLAQVIRLCELLSIDPRQTLDVTIEWNGKDRRPVARWSGLRYLSKDEVAQLGQLLSDTPAQGGDDQ